MTAPDSAVPLSGEELAALRRRTEAVRNALRASAAEWSRRPNGPAYEAACKVVEAARAEFADALSPSVVARLLAMVDERAQALRPALEFYANPRAWATPEPHILDGSDEPVRYSSPAVADGGDCARLALYAAARVTSTETTDVR